jgi:hypothetical protein
MKACGSDAALVARQGISLGDSEMCLAPAVLRVTQFTPAVPSRLRARGHAEMHQKDRIVPGWLAQSHGAFDTVQSWRCVMEPAGVPAARLFRCCPKSTSPPTYKCDEVCVGMLCRLAGADVRWSGPRVSVSCALRGFALWYIQGRRRYSSARSFSRVRAACGKRNKRCKLRNLVLHAPRWTGGP